MHTRRHTHLHLPCVMGCSKSKEEKESSSKMERKEAWEALLTKPPKLDSTVKRLDTGYIASIFSANYNTALKRAQHHTKIEKDDLLLPHTLPCTGGSARKGTSKFANARTHRKASSDTTLVQRLRSIHKREALTSQKGAEADVESTNFCELMKDLDQEGSFLKVGSPPKILQEAGSLTDSPKQSSQAKVPHAVCMLKRSITLPRVKYLTLFDSTEDVHTLLVASKNSASSEEENPCIVRDGAVEVEDLAEPSSLKLFNTTHYSGGVPAENDGVNTRRHTCDTSHVESVPLGEATFDAETHPQTQTSSEKPRNLQKALSMKYILNDISIENEGSIENEELRTPSHMPADNYAVSQLSMLQVMLHNKDDDDGASLSYESNSSSCLSSPEVSSAASLKDWLPAEEPPPLMPAADFYEAEWSHSIDPPLILAADFYQAGTATSIFDAVEASRTFLGSDLLPSTKRVLLKYLGGDYNLPLDDDATQESPPVVTSEIDTSKRATEQLCIHGPPPTTKSDPQEELYNLAELWKDSTF